MKTTLSLAKKTLIFYSILAVPIMIGSFHNLIYGVILRENNSVWLGAFSLFGFILFPILLLSTYRRNKCVIENDKIIIGKSEYAFTDYNFKISEYKLSIKDRPLFSLFKSKYHNLLVENKKTKEIELEQSLDVFKSDLELLKSKFSS
jgi:hypothetical protein